jgi:hypothetical protein
MDSVHSLLLSGDVFGALDRAESFAVKNPKWAATSSDFMTLAAKICTQTRKWYTAQFLASLALERNTFTDPTSREWCTAIAAYTTGCDLVLRLAHENPNHWNELPVILAWFNEADGLVGAEYLREWMLLVSGRCPVFPEVHELLQNALQRVVGANGTSLLKLRAQQRLFEMSQVNPGEKWVLQVDASEVGNEARYINHADMPNAVLVNKLVPGIPHGVPTVVAIRSIQPGDEITINYGPAYWARIKHERAAEPLLFGRVLEQPFTDCLYYDGFLYDYACTGTPSGFLIPPGSRNHNANRSSLGVKRVSFEHPAFPGFGVCSKTFFQKGDEICKYAGVIDMSPYSGRTGSKYTVDLSVRDPVGPFAFSMDPDTLTCNAVQTHLPFISDYADISLPLADGEMDPLKGVCSLRGVDERTTQIVTTALVIPEYRDIVRERLASIKPLPMNGNKRDIQAFTAKVKKSFDDVLTKPPTARKNVLKHYFL